MATAVVAPEDDGCNCGHSHHAHAHAQHESQDSKNWINTDFFLSLLDVVLIKNPLMTLLVYCVVNTLFMVIWWLLSLIAAVITPPGVVLALGVSIFLGLRKITSLLVYPGQLELVIRDGEANFARLTKRRLTMFIESANELAAVLGDTDLSANKRLRYLQAHQNFMFTMDTLVMPLLKSLEFVEKEGQLGPNGETLLSALRGIFKCYMRTLSPLCVQLGAVLSKDFEAKRQQLFLTTAVSTNDASSGTDVQSSTKKSTPISMFAITLQRVHAAIPLIGAPTGEKKRDIAWLGQQLCQRKQKNVDTITNLDLMRADMSVRFKGEQVWITGHRKHQIDAMFIPGKSGFDADRPTVIICNPNGGLYEFHHLQMDWIKFYTDLDCHVLIFNYRGYGRNTGTPSPGDHNLDALAIVDYLKSKRGIKKIGVHGESIGGLVATFLARHSKDICVLIVDRTFSTLPALAQRLIAGWAGTAVNILTRWETDNVTNYMSVTCPKLLCSDPCDDIILDGASLKTGVALRLELGDQTFAPPTPSKQEKDIAQSSSYMGTFSPSMSAWNASLFSCPSGAQTKRRISEADSHPHLGGPLTEQTLRRFSEAVLSIGKRALEYTIRRDANVGTEINSKHVVISVKGESDSQVEINEINEVNDDTDQEPMLKNEKPALSFSEELLAVVWMQLACLDGYCGQCLLQAAESGGYDKIRAWTASLLVWGGRMAPAQRNQLSLGPFERQSIEIVPLTITQVHATLQKIVEEHPTVKFDFDIGFLILMIEFLYDSLQRRWQQMDEEQKNDNNTAKKLVIPQIIQTHDSKLGYLLPLHCGHNKNYLHDEKEALVAFLRHTGFVS